jgi:hypothetical protein
MLPCGLSGVQQRLVGTTYLMAWGAAGETALLPPLFPPMYARANHLSAVQTVLTKVATAFVMADVATALVMADVPTAMVMAVISPQRLRRTVWTWQILWLMTWLMAWLMTWL